jgi:crotonobetainyl-CoA:carnitine CoA-transferase CaiB-like acyl-CoA transferase
LCRALDLGALVGDPRFATNAARLRNREALDAALAPRLRTEPRAIWLERLRAADILCGPVNTVGDALADPALRAALPILETGLPDAPQVLGGPIHRDGEFLPLCRAAPLQGEHTREVLRELGYAPADVDALLASGAAFAEG